MNVLENCFILVYGGFRDTCFKNGKENFKDNSTRKTELYDTGVDNCGCTV
jgi:hypothetical protein